MVDTTKIVDGVTVIVPEEGRRNVTFHLSNLFRYRFVDGGGTGGVTEAGKYIPLVNDIAYATPEGEWWVSAVNPSTYVADLKMRNTANPAGVDLTSDLYLSTGSGYASESWRMYLDTSVVPYVAVIDGGFRIYHEDAVLMKVFEGVDTTSSGTVISAYYNQDGVYVSENIPLEVVGTYETDGLSVGVPVNNISIKAPKRFYSTKALQNGAVVTAVFYTSEGFPLKVAHMLVHRSNAIRKPDTASKRIRGIELVSTWLSNTEPDVLRVPINVTVSTVGMMARVIYIDGTRKELPVGGERSTNQFKLIGLDFWSPNVAGTSQRLDLTYTLSPNEEYAYPDGETANGVILKDYTIHAEAVRDAYNLKMYVFPSYRSGNQGYALEGWMYDMTRSIGRRVPASALRVVEGFPSFNGLDYTTVQHMRMSVDMNALDPAYGNYKHVQNVQIALLRDGVHPPTNWRLKQSGNQMYWYGDDLEARTWAAPNPILSIINIANGFTDQQSWLEGLYWRLDPLFDRATESRAPIPTHFVLATNTREFEFPISSWGSNLSYINDVTNGGTIYIKWVHRLADRDLQLGVSGLPLKFVV